jgi:hypothetical protein
MTSADAGEHWVLCNSGTSDVFNGVAYGNGVFVIAGAGPKSGTIFTSADGLNWTPQNSTNLAGLTGIAFGNRIFVAMASSGSRGFYLSRDGVSWVQKPSPITFQTISINFMANRFIATAQNGAVLSSPDGIFWTYRQLPTGYRYRASAASETQAVLVGDNGSIYSADLPSGSDTISLQMFRSKLADPLDLKLTGVPAHLYGIETSTNLIDWSSLTNLTLAATTNVSSLTTSNASNAQFFRGVNP